MLRKLSRMVFVFGLLAVAALSVLPPDSIPPTGYSDEMAHTAAYAALALAGGIAFKGTRSFLLMAFGLLVLGGALELVQAFIPGRYASGSDILANTIGVVLGSVCAVATNGLAGRLLKSAG